MAVPTIEPPRVLPETLDRRLYRAIHGLPHTPMSDRYVAMLSDLGEGMGWLAAAIAVAWLDGRRGRRAAIATAVACLGTAYTVQRLVKPVFSRDRPFVGREIVVVGIRGADPSFPSGHTASSFAAATAMAAFYPRAAPLVFAFASMVGVSRVHLGHHFPSDVAAGGALGAAAGALVAWLLHTPRSI